MRVTPSTLRPEGRSMLRVDPERRFFTPPSKAKLGAAEWVNILSFITSDGNSVKTILNSIDAMGSLKRSESVLVLFLDVEFMIPWLFTFYFFPVNFKKL
jgi:hypothetical protein